MATHINDLGHSTVVKPILAPQVLEAENPTGVAADLGEGDGACFAVQVIGTVEGEATLTGRIEESSDQSTWTAISGAAFTATAAAGTSVIRFLRTKRYLRWAGTYSPGEGDTIAASVLVIQGKKIS